MNKPKFSGILKSVQTMVTHHTPEILTGIGIAGMITTTILAVKATPKALQLLEEREEEHIPPIEVVKTTWKCYIPAAVTGTLSVVCLIGASSVNARRNAALATAYKLSETALSEYREKVVETLGEKKEQKIREQIAEDKINKNPPSKEIIVTGNGETQCYDLTFGRYFKSSMEALKGIENKLNKRMRDEMDISLNEFYYEVGLESVEAGDLLGWNIDRGYIELEFSSHLDKYGTPCLAVAFGRPPTYDYR